MGFDIYVSASFTMCNKVGKPYYFRANPGGGMECSYELPSIQVPAHLCKYLAGRGPIFTAYTEMFEEEGLGLVVGADQFLEAYPDWEDVVESDFYVDEPDAWNEEDHNRFKELINWCVNQEYFFTVSWSY